MNVLVKKVVFLKTWTYFGMLVPILLLMEPGTIEDLFADLATLDSFFETYFTEELLRKDYAKTIILRLFFDSTDMGEIITIDHNS